MEASQLKDWNSFLKNHETIRWIHSYYFFCGHIFFYPWYFCFYYGSVGGRLHSGLYRVRFHQSNFKADQGCFRSHNTVGGIYCIVPKWAVSILETNCGQLDIYPSTFGFSFFKIFVYPQITWFGNFFLYLIIFNMSL